MKFQKVVKMISSDVKTDIEQQEIKASSCILSFFYKKHLQNLK